MTARELAMMMTAALLLLLAHAVRAFRWSLLFPRNRSEPDRRGLLLSLGVGYAVNAIIPLRIGEIVRGAVACRLRQARFAEVMATIVAERLSDIALVAIFVSSMAFASGDTALPKTVLAYASAFAVFAVVAVMLRHSAALRRLLWSAAAIFNPRIRLAIADFIWSTAEILVGGTLVKWQFTMATFVMWLMYFAAYAAFASAIDVPLFGIVEALLLQPLSSFLAGSSSTIIASLDLKLFVLAPVALILAGFLLKRGSLPAERTVPRSPIRSPGPHFASRTRYSTLSGYEDFLDAMFSNARSAVSGFGMQAVDDCIVHGFYYGGSEALIALIETSDQMLIRKFGMGTAAVKLRQQADWLRRHGQSEVPLVPVFNFKSGPGAFSYDMPLRQRASPFYEAVHSMPMADSRNTLLGVLDRIDRLHNGHKTEPAAASHVDEYLAKKVSANARQIADFARSAIGGEDYRINGADYHLDEWRHFQDGDWLSRQVRNRGQAVIHGDLTVENVVLASEQEYGFYLIDPNPENIFDSPLIDWAKMMQSLHLGYETLNRSGQAGCRDREIVLPFARSEAYAGLHNLLESEITSRFSTDALREVYFHELVNYLRLTPYKMRQAPERGLAFFACTSILLRKYRQQCA